MIIAYAKTYMERLNIMRKQKDFRIAVWTLWAFVLWTIAIQWIDVQPIGPLGSSVGFATVNGFVHNLTGVHMVLYLITDWLSVVPIGFVLVFAVLGLSQWIRRRHLFKVDFDLLVLGGFYMVVIAAYILFEVFVVNYRPVLIDGVLEASYPSSTTMLVMCIMPTAVMQLRARIKDDSFKRIVVSVIVAFTIFMVIGRIISGVHWVTDIIGGALLSAGLVGMYGSILRIGPKCEL